MKKIISLILIVYINVSIFAATFSKGQTVYISKDSPVTTTEKSSRAIASAAKGDFGVVIESNNKKTNVRFNSSNISGWVDTKNLTKKKVVKGTVSTKIDNIALSGKGFVQSTKKENKTTNAKTNPFIEKEETISKSKINF